MMSILTLLVSFQSFATGGAGCERKVAAKILTIKEVDGRLEHLAAISDNRGRIPSREEVRALDKENSIYFHAYQMAETVCDRQGIIEKLPREDE
jgi:hypothetical protein